jgi:raffinose/stachyose/melibiose transport system substrate-binding protein
MKDRPPLRVIAALALVPALAVTVAGCAPGDTAGASGDRESIELWFWGAPAAHQAELEADLVDAFNDSQSEYELSVSYDPDVDANIQVALSAGEGPDVVFGSGPSFVAPYAEAGKLVNLDEYSEEYGWKDRLLDPIYESGTVDGSLYAVANSVDTQGIFYNKAVLDEHGWDVPTTVDDLTTIMDEAQAAGLYSSVTGNKGVQFVNLNYVTTFLTTVAGPDKVYDALTGAGSWTDPAIEESVALNSEWYNKGYFAGDDYTNLNFPESMQLLAQGEAPFFIGPALAFQFATDFFNDEVGNTDDLGFTNFPTISDDLSTPLYPLGTTASFSINAASENPDGAAAVIDFMLTEDFMKTMTSQWPGYWGVPLKGVTLDPADYEGLSAQYVAALADMFENVENGSFGYSAPTFFPPVTLENWIDVDQVWNGTMTPADFLAEIQTDFDKELADGDVPPIPAQN